MKTNTNQLNFTDSKLIKPKHSTASLRGDTDAVTTQYK